MTLLEGAIQILFLTLIVPGVKLVPSLFHIFDSGMRLRRKDDGKETRVTAYTILGNEILSAGSMTGDGLSQSNVKFPHYNLTVFSTGDYSTAIT